MEEGHANPWAQSISCYFARASVTHFVIFVFDISEQGKVCAKALLPLRTDWNSSWAQLGYMLVQAEIFLSFMIWMSNSYEKYMPK